MFIFVPISIHNVKYVIGTKILISKCFDHGTTCMDTHSKIPPDRHIYVSKSIVWTRFQPPKSNLNKQTLTMLAFAANELWIFSYFRKTSFGLLYILTYWYTYIFISFLCPSLSHSLSLYICFYIYIYTDIYLYSYVYTYI